MPSEGSARRWLAALGIGCALAALPDAAVAQHAATVGAKLERALVKPLPAEGLPIRVSLRRSDLPALGRGRQAAVRARQDRVLSALPAGFRLGFRYRALSGFSGLATRGAIEALRRHPEVDGIWLDREVRATLAEGTALSGADAAQALGFTGEYINVAVLDTGVDRLHLDLKDSIVAEYCACDSHPSPFGACCPHGGFEEFGEGSAQDDNGHGTHTAGIITSDGLVAPLGVAPAAGIVAVKVLSSSGGGLDSGIEMGLDWVILNREALGIRVVNMSLGDGGENNDPGAGDCSGTPTANSIAMLHAAGVAVFVSAGNDGHDDGISAPACVAEAISVGGVYDVAEGSVGWCGNSRCNQALCTDVTGPDVFVCHSNSDEILDLLAPDWRTTVPDLGGGVTDFGGTSASSPYAAGQAALLLDADDTLGPEEIRTLLKGHGPMVTNPDNGLSFRRSDVAEALAALPVCGNGTPDPGEDCDDGGAPGGCCSAGCLFEPNGTSCDDGDACTEADVCDGAGLCGGATLDCGDGNLCTDDSCDSATGCINLDNTDPCDDGNACTTADTCSEGACFGGTPPECDDGDPCTTETCDVFLGCQSEPIEACGAPVPAVTLWPRLLLFALVMLVGAARTRTKD